MHYDPTYKALNQADNELPASPARMFTAMFSATPSVVEGIDINFNQGGQLVDADAVYASGRRFAIVEAAWGLYEPDTFKTFWPPLLDAGVFLMAYIFFRGDQDGADQADFVLNVTRPMFEAQGCKSVIFSDVEKFTGDTSTPTIRIPRWHDLNAGILREMKAGTYSNIPSWTALMNNEPLPDDVIGWVAHYTRYWESFLYPIGWRKEQVRFLQYGIAMVHDWCPAVPGISGDVSVDKFFGTEQQLYALCEDIQPPVPPPPGDDDMELLEAISKAQDLNAQLTVQLEEVKRLAEEGGEPEPPPDPEPPPPPPADETITIQITKDPRSNARFIKGYNDAGKPIMEIYPSDSSKTSERIQFDYGTKLKAKADKITADGGKKYYWLTQHYGRDGEPLYIYDQEASKV